MHKYKSNLLEHPNKMSACFDHSFMIKSNICMEQELITSTFTRLITTGMNMELCLSPDLTPNFLMSLCSRRNLKNP